MPMMGAMAIIASTKPKSHKPTEDAGERISERGWRGKHQQQIKYDCEDGEG